MTRILGFLALFFAAMTLSAAEGDPRQTAPDILAQDAPIALLVDVQSGQTLYERGADRRFIPASITKVMTAYVAFEMIDGGKLSTSQNFTMSKQAAEDWYRTGSTMFLEEGQSVPVDTLLRGITSVSANDACIVLAEGASGSVDAWVSLMNKTARNLGMQNSHFGTPNGWPDEGATFTTARDLEILAKALIGRHPKLYARYFGQAGLRFNGFAQANHDPISGVVDGADGIKTGFTNQAGYGFLGSAQRGDTRLIMVLGAIDSHQQRADMARGLMEWGFRDFDRTLLYAKGAIVARAKVQDGESAEVDLRAAHAITAAMPKSAQIKPVLSVVYDGPLKAPVKAGETVAKLEISVAGMPSAYVPLTAAVDIEKAGFFKRISNAFAGWFG